MRRSTILIVAATAFVLTACGSGEIAVTAEIDVPDPTQDGAMQTQPLNDVEVQLVPFDRDQVFDSLEAAADSPEPEIPEDVLVAQDSIAAAQERWNSLEARWNTLRDTLQKLTDAMTRYNRGEARYRQLYQLYNDLDGQYSRVARQKDQAFARLDSLQKANTERANQTRIERENWAAEAFATVDEVFRNKVRVSGLEIYVDTTNAQGVANFEGLTIKPGRYWVTGRYELPFTELYWNEPVEIPRGEPTVVELSRANAEERPRL